MDTQERRDFPRHPHRLEGSWRGASGASSCRIVDLSWSGCFVETVAAPTIGEQTEVTIKIGADEATLTGAVNSVFHGIGFGVQFTGLSARDYNILFTILGEPAPPRPDVA